jgi:hypothetical protein
VWSPRPTAVCGIARYAYPGYDSVYPGSFRTAADCRRARSAVRPSLYRWTGGGGRLVIRRVGILTAAARVGLCECVVGHIAERPAPQASVGCGRSSAGAPGLDRQPSDRAARGARCWDPVRTAPAPRPASARPCSVDGSSHVEMGRQSRPSKLLGDRAPDQLPAGRAYMHPGSAGRRVPPV